MVLDQKLESGQRGRPSGQGRSAWPWGPEPRLNVQLQLRFQNEAHTVPGSLQEHGSGADCPRLAS